MKHVVIGLGSIGQRHAAILRSQGEEVIGVDIAPSKKFPFPVYEQLQDIGHPDFDVVWICTPTHIHSRQAIESLNKGVHLFVEKPVAHTLESADSIRRAWEKMPNKKMVWVACNMRFHPAVIKLRRLIAAGIIGQPRIHRIHFSHFIGSMRPGRDYRKTYAAHSGEGGGVLLDDIHDIDLALWFGGPVKTACGLASRSPFLGIDAEDIAQISLIHENGTFTEIHMDFLRPNKSRGIEVVGETGTLEWRSLGKNPERASITWYGNNQDEPKEVWQAEVDPDEMYRLQFAEVCERVQQPADYGLRLAEGIEALRIALQVRESS